MKKSRKIYFTSSKAKKIFKILIVFILVGFSYFIYFYSAFGSPSISPALACNSKSTPIEKCIEVNLYQGIINPAGVDDLKKLLSSNGRKYLCFDSGGGSSSESIKIAKLIKQYGLIACMANTYKTDEGNILGYNSSCLSNCIPTLLSAKERHLFGTSEIRTHRIGMEWVCEINRKMQRLGIQTKFTGNFPKFIGIKQYMNIVKEGHERISPEFKKLASDTMEKSNYCEAPDKKLSLQELHNYKIFTQIFDHIE